MKQHIMITRPAHQSAQLVKAIKQAGANAFSFPTLEILAAELSEENKKKLENINQYDILIFISPNAVTHGLDQIQNMTKIAEHTRIATVGQGSANALETVLGKQPDIVPEKNFNSEGLLATADLQNVSDKNILIIRGNGGREHLKNTLKQRGATVDYLNVYKRVKPQADTTELEQYLQNKQIAAIVISSAASLKNLVEMTPNNVSSNLLKVPLILINKRLVDIAQQAGFTGKLTIAEEASDAGMLNSLKEFIC